MLDIILVYYHYLKHMFKLGHLEIKITNKFLSSNNLYNDYVHNK